MLNGVDPIIIFQFSKLADQSLKDQIAKIPVISKIPTVIDEPPIPIYLSERLSGILVDSESKQVDIQTEVSTLTSGDESQKDQKGVANTVTVNLQASKYSIGAILLSALIDKAFNKVTSKEYKVTYMNGAITVFRGLIESFNSSQVPDTDLLSITLVLTSGELKPEEPKTDLNIERYKTGVSASGAAWFLTGIEYLICQNLMRVA